MPIDRRIGNRVLSRTFNGLSGPPTSEWFSGRACRIDRPLRLSSTCTACPTASDFDTAITLRLLENGDSPRWPSPRTTATRSPGAAARNRPGRPRPRSSTGGASAAARAGLDRALRAPTPASRPPAPRSPRAGPPGCARRSGAALRAEVVGVVEPRRPGDVDVGHGRPSGTNSCRNRCGERPQRGRRSSGAGIEVVAVVRRQR